MDAYIIVNTQVYPLRSKRLTIGRHLDNDIVVQESIISRQHAEIRFENGEYILKDLASTGGTYINGSKIKEQVLHSGDSITLAGVAVVFVRNVSKLSSHSMDTTDQLRIPGYDDSKTIQTDENPWIDDDDSKK